MSEQDKPIVGDHTAILAVGQREFYFPSDMQALELAESLPDCVDWRVRLRHDRGIVDSKDYRKER